MASTAQQEETKTEETKIEEEDIEAPTETVQLPESLVAKQKDYSKRDKCISTFFNNLYDILTIFISVADITTDLIVLVSFYNSNQMTFFWISFTILIIAQIGYLIVFLFSFEIEDFMQKVTDFCCCQCKCWSSKCCRALEKCLSKCCSKLCGCDCNCDCNCHCKLCDNKNSMAYKICDKIGEGIVIVIYLILSAIAFAIVAVVVISIFVFLLPFGHLVSFLMYFAENEESSCGQWLSNKVGFKKRTNIPLEEHWSEMALFTAKKINKHGGFILEAFLEALPQSILQLIAMVYFKQTNLISVGSILLSMTSIMTKALVLSQGLEWKSFLFTWLSVCTDFFSIFFIVSWIFLSNEYVNGDFLGHFSVIGQFWCWKVAIAIIAPLAYVVIAYFTVAMWFIVYTIVLSNSDEKLCYQILMVILFLTLGNAALAAVYAIAAFIVFLIAEIACFSIMAGFIYLFLTLDRWDYTEKKISNVIKKLIYFIGGASYKNNDRIIRILCINYAYKNHDALAKYILEQKRNERLHEISYKDIRNNCKKPKTANFLQTGMQAYCNGFGEFKKECIDGFDQAHKFDSICLLLWTMGLLLAVYISLPIYILSRIVTILYPYFIIGYLYYYDLWFKMHIFELSMLLFYILLQLMLLILFIFVFRTHKWLWHIAPGYDEVRGWNDDMIPLWKKCYSFYDAIQWIPVTREIVFHKFGTDIGAIIIDYLKDY